MYELTTDVDQESRSDEAWIIKAFYDDKKELGWYTIEDMETGEELCSSVIIEGSASVNIIYFFAIQGTLSACEESSYCPEIYCTNKAAFKWYMQARCDSKKYDKETLRNIVCCELIFNQLERPGRVIYLELDEFKGIKNSSD